ncbi:MAG: chromosomal replication initiator protein DnaA [Phycisphaerae bacterium]|nr:chromosomal replication initiator protein DnaA [Phycisphaerae bacterium]
MNGITDTVWGDILGQLRVHHPELVRGWFSQLVPVHLDHGVLEIRAANESQQRYLSDHCVRPFVEAAQAATGRLISVRFTINEIGLVTVPPESASLTVEQETTPLTLNSMYSFPEFVTGPSNRLAHAACVAVSESPGMAYNPLFIHGNVGLGKTHLLQATCHRALELDPSAQILYLTCETFTNHFIEAVERGAMNSFRYRYRHVDVLVIDDIQFLAERERSQEEFFHTFNTLYQIQKQIILSADSPPSEIPSLEDRLVSRFNWGLVASIDPPCLDTRIAIVRKKAKSRKLSLSDEVVHYVASNVTSNARELEGAILQLHALAAQRAGTVDLDLAREALGQAPSSLRVPISVPTILNAVTKYYGVRLADLQSRKRTKSIAFPRQVCMYLARTLTSHSLEEIGGYFGGRDHTTVLHATKTISRLQETDPEFRDTLDSLRNSLQQ